MKKQFLNLILFCLLIGGSCTGYEKDEAARQKVGLAQASRDSLENEFVRTMDDINKNLDIIREKQGLIASPGMSEDLSMKNEILKNISLINSLIDENKKKIEELTKRGKDLDQQNNALSKIAQQTKTRIEKQENEIINLKQLLAMEEFKVADLNVKMDELQVANEILIAEKNSLTEANMHLDKDLNKAFFTYGTAAELQEKKIIEKKGGVLGVGKRNTLANAFYKNRSYFTELDVREVKTIPIQGVKPKLVTFHPEGSYELKETNEQYSSLNIVDPSEFWSTSRFLVIQVK